MTPKDAIELNEPSPTGDLQVRENESLARPTAGEFAVLSPMERISVRLVGRMNRGVWKRFWTTCQRYLGSFWIYLATNNLTRVYGFEHLDEVSHKRPLLLVANHRSFFDMYVVSSLLYRKTNWVRALYFPVRGRFFYESPLGWFVNWIMGWWSMWPPFFAEGAKREFDKFSLRRLVALADEGPGTVIGFHPEGTRNKGEDPYTFLRAQPGVGKLLKESGAQVIPVFIAGLGNNLGRQILGNWTGGERVRIRFGAPVDVTRFMTERDSVRTYKAIADYLMERIGELAEDDRQEMANRG